MRKILCLIALWLSVWGVVQADDVELSPIQAENADQVQYLGRFGRGVATSLDWHPDGEILAVGSATGVWLLDETLQILTPTPITQHIKALAWSPDGSQIAVNLDCQIEIWTADFSENLLSLARCVRDVIWSPDGKYLALSVSNQGGALWDVSKQTITEFTGGQALWSPSSLRLFTSFWKDEVRMLYTWDVLTGDLLSETVIDTGYYPLLWSDDEESVLVGCGEIRDQPDHLQQYGVCRVDIFTGMGEWEHVIHQQNLDYSQYWLSLNKVALSGDGGAIGYHVVASHPAFSDIIFRYDLEDGAITSIADGHTFDWKPHSHDLTALVGNGQIKTYGEHPAESHFFTNPINQIAIRPNQFQIASTGYGYYQHTYVWDREHSWHEPLLNFYAEPAQMVDYNLAGDELIAGGEIITDTVVNRMMQAFDADTGEHTRYLTSYYSQSLSDPIMWDADYRMELVLPDTITYDDFILLGGGPYQYKKGVLWSPDYSLIATLERPQYDDSHMLIHLWDAVTGERIRTAFSTEMYWFYDFEWSPDGSMMAVWFALDSGDGAGVSVFSIDGTDFQTMPYNGANRLNIKALYHGESRQPQSVRLVWSPDSSMIAVIMPNVLEIYALDNEMPLFSTPIDPMIDLKWSADGRLIATGSADGTVHVWGVAGGDGG